MAIAALPVGPGIEDPYPVTRGALPTSRIQTFVHLDLMVALELMDSPRERLEMVEAV
jgi:hypothetical protein